jgi:hypothetical protein
MNKENSLFLRDYASPESILRARGIYLNGSETEDISGVALYASGICSPYLRLDRIVVLLGVEQSETLFVLVWSRVNTWIGFGPLYPSTFIFLSAAKLYQTEVKIL